MNLSISNIAWDQRYDDLVYAGMKALGYSGIEIAPTKIFGADAYAHFSEASQWSTDLMNNYGLSVSSMQSIWFGRNESLFGTPEERTELIEYTKKAIIFAQNIKCRNLVFGCPKNRNIPICESSEIAVDFFKELGDFAYQHDTVLALEANPTIYNTNFINTTPEALNLIDLVDSEGFLLNLDVGTMIENNEDLSILNDHSHVINHVHISEPYLAPVLQRPIHQDLASFLRAHDYHGYVSIETKTNDNIDEIIRMMEYLTEVFS